MNTSIILENLGLQEEAYGALAGYKITYESLLEILGTDMDWFNLYAGRGHYLSKTLCQSIVATVQEKLAQTNNTNIAPK